MRTLRLLVLPWITVLFLAGCSPKADDTPPEPTPEAVVAPEKSKQDVTVCITALTPDELHARVKADGKQRVCWKGHGAAYEVRFKTADWPFEESAPAIDGEWSVIRVESLKASELYTLKERLSAGQESKHSYWIGSSPATTFEAPPGGPEIIGEG